MLKSDNKYFKKKPKLPKFKLTVNQYIKKGLTQSKNLMENNTFFVFIPSKINIQVFFTVPPPNFKHLFICHSIFSLQKEPLSSENKTEA